MLYFHNEQSHAPKINSASSLISSWPAALPLFLFETINGEVCDPPFRHPNYFMVSL